MSVARPLPRNPPRRWSHDDPVVLRPVYKDQRVPYFGEDVWDLACVYQPGNRVSTRLNFSNFPWDQRITAKELVAKRLNAISVSSRSDRSRKGFRVRTCMQMLSSLRGAFRMMAEHGLRSIPEITQDHLDIYKDELVGRYRNGMTTAAVLNVFVWLWEDREFLSRGGLSFNPWQGRSPTSVINYERPEGNATERIPPAVMSGILRASLTYVDHFADDIIAAATDLFERQVGDRAWYTRDRTSGRPSAGHLARRIERSDRVAMSSRTSRSRSDGEHAEDRQLEMFSGRLGPDLELLRAPTFIPEGRRQPWREPMTVDEMTRECIHLCAAAYVVVAYLSGMRDSEVQDLRSGCLSRELDSGGNVVRYRLKGRTLKGKRSWEEREWVVIEPVARAIAVLERLTKNFRERTRDDHLFVKPHYAGRSSPLFREEINVVLRGLLMHWNSHIATLDGTDDSDPTADPKEDVLAQLRAVPPHDGKPWHLVSSQFRRTLAWHIANQPFGEIAAMIQFGHAYLQVTEGYCGSREDGFVSEVARERDDARIGKLVHMLDEDSRGRPPAGPMAPELKALFAQAEAELGPFPGIMADDRRLRELLRMKATQMHVGVLAHCFYVPGRARCQRDLEEGARHEPVTGLCDPNCGNACWTRDHLDAWQDLAEDTRRLLKSNSRPGLQQDVLRRQLKQIAGVVKAIEGGDDGRQA